MTRYFTLTWDCTVCELVLTVTFIRGQGGRATCSQCETVYDLGANVRIVKRGSNRA